MGIMKGKDLGISILGEDVTFMGSISWGGVVADKVEQTAMGDDWKSFATTLKDGGTVQVSGLADLSDVAQELIRYHQNQGTDITDFKIYMDRGKKHYFAPCSVAGYFSPTHTTGANTKVSWVNVDTQDFDADKSGLVNFKFSLKVSGSLVEIVEP